MNNLFDVVAVNIKSGVTRLIAENKTECNANAIEFRAIMRRGVEDEFFATVPHGKYKAGDKWEG